MKIWRRHSDKSTKLYVLSGYESQGAEEIASIFERIRILMVALAIAPQGITREDVRQYIEDSKKQMELVELEADDSRDEDFFA